jgi:hypothetical protein
MWPSLRCDSSIEDEGWMRRLGMRKQTVEPVFGIIKSVMGFRQFSLRGWKKVTGEWNLVCLAWNLKRMAVLRPKIG